MSLRLSQQWLHGVAFPVGLLVLPVFVDIAFGMLGTSGRAGFLSIGVVVRGSIALLAILLLVRMRATPLKTLLFILLGIFLASNVIWALASPVYSLGHELNQGFKVAFPWLIAGTLLYLDRRQTIDPALLLTLIAWSGFLSAAALIGAAALGIDSETYGHWSYGSKGMFNAQNDIGLTLVLTLVAAAALLARTRRMLHLVMTATIACASFLLGTRTGVLGPPLVAIALLLSTFLNRRLLRPADHRTGLGQTAVLVLPVAIVALVAGIVLSQSEKTSFLFKQIESLSEGTPRSHLEAAGMERLQEREPVFTLVGDGGLAFKMYVAENAGRGRQMIDFGTLTAMGESQKFGFRVHRVENDVIDVLGFYGVLQFAVIYGALALVYGIALRRAVRAWNLENVAWLLIFTLFLGHSTLAGHGLFSPQVSTMIAPVLFLQLRDLSWRRVNRPVPSTVETTGIMEAEER
ncbi:MAG: hypothetical protein HKM95_03430 [Inquilinus sp.]|nr:hypothetical protein [Inquilinus sp.]